MAQALQQLAESEQATQQAAEEIAGQSIPALPAISQAEQMAEALMPGEPENGPPHLSHGMIGGGMTGPRKFVKNRPVTGGTPAHKLPPAPASLPNSAEDAKSQDRRFAEDPWFAKLPPEVRTAIRSSAERRPPRGYEEKLDRYFKNKD